MTFELVIARIRQAMLLDVAAYEETRDDSQFTPFAIGAWVVAVLRAGIGEWLFGDTILNVKPSGWFVDTMIFGTIFTIVLFLIGVAVIYLVLSQGFGERRNPEGRGAIVT